MLNNGIGTKRLREAIRRANNDDEKKLGEIMAEMYKQVLTGSSEIVIDKPYFICKLHNSKDQINS